MATGSQGRRRAATHSSGAPVAAVHRREARSTFGDKSPTFPNPRRGGAASLTFRSDGNQFHSFTGDEVERFVDVGDLVHSHLASLRFGQTFAWVRRRRGKKMGVRIFFTMTFYAFKVPSRAKSHSRSSPEMTSSSSMSFSPSLKSSSMLSICVPAFLRWELHQAVNVCRQTRRKLRVRGCLQTNIFETPHFQKQLKKKKN